MTSSRVYCALARHSGSASPSVATPDGREVLAVFRSPGGERPGYFIELGITHGRIAAIRDFRYVPYIARVATIEPARGPDTR